MPMPKTLLLTLLLAFPMVSSADTDTDAAARGAAPSNGPQPFVDDCDRDPIGLIRLQSPDSVAETADRVESLIRQNPNLTLFTRVDHAQNAQSAGLDLPPTTLLIFGNPDLGTPLMQAERTVAIDLPQKMLVWEDDEGQTWIGYNDPQYLKWRHDVRDKENVFHTIATALSQLAEQAGRP